jgi:hypothetical protein
MDFAVLKQNGISTALRQELHGFGLANAIAFRCQTDSTGMEKGELPNDALT